MGVLGRAHRRERLRLTGAGAVAAQADRPGLGRVGGVRLSGGLCFRRAATERCHFVGGALAASRSVLVGVQAGSDGEVSDWAGSGGGCLARFWLGRRRIGPEHERFLVLWVMRVFLGWGIIGVRTGIWIPYRSRVGVSRLSQASGLLAPLAGSETTRPALGSGGAQPGACMVCPTCYRDSLPGRESQKDGLGTWSGRSPGRDHPNRRQCPERGTHHQTATDTGRTHRKVPLTAVDSTQSAVGNWQYSAPST